jgi:hypothetical protein
MREKKSLQAKIGIAASITFIALLGVILYSILIDIFAIPMYVSCILIVLSALLSAIYIKLEE